MIIQHIVHGFLIVVVVFFGLPAIFALAASNIAGGKTSSSLSLRFLSKSLRIIMHGFESLSDAIATGFAVQYPENQGWLKPVLKHALVALFVFGSLYLVSILTSR